MTHAHECRWGKPGN